VLQTFKDGLPPYTASELSFDGVKVTAVEVETVGADHHDVFETFWQQDDIELSRGLDFFARSNVYARTTHLDHTPFKYKIKVNGQTKSY